MRSIILLVHNIRSTHNVGSLLRTSDGLGIESVIFSGYTPYPTLPGDVRLPHISTKLTNAISKTALGAEQTVSFTYEEDIVQAIYKLKSQGYRLVALEQAESSIPLPEYRPHDKTVLLIGEEVYGITADLLGTCDDIVEIPMYGQKESYNVSVASGIALYHLRCS